MVQLIVRATAAAGRAGQLIDALRSVMHAVRREEEFSDVRLATDAENGSVIWFCEEWPTIEDCEGHLRSAQFARVLAAIETAAEPPLFEFRLISETRGIEYAAAVRGAMAGDVGA